MKLSRLIYEVVTGTLALPNQTNYNSFIQGEYREDNDYAMQTANALNYVNLAMSRLFEYDKMPHFVSKAEVVDGKVSTMGLGDVVNVQHDKEPIEWRLIGGNEIKVDLKDGEEIYIEYKMQIPYFTEDNIITEAVNDDGSVEMIGIDIELKDYGIQDRMIPYIVEFAKSQVMEIISPELAVNHNNRAEQYFNSMPKAQQILAQTRMKVLSYE